MRREPGHGSGAALRRARGFFATGATRPVSFRESALRRLDRAIEAHEPALLDALRAELGKPAQEAYASELGVVRTDIGHALRHVRQRDLFFDDLLLDRPLEDFRQALYLGFLQGVAAIGF